MAKRTLNNLKLGIFVLSGLALIIVALYLLSRNQSLFNPRFEVYAHFENVNGLVSGNNVRLNGIVVGTVGSIRLMNDTLVEVQLEINNDMLGVIRKNAQASIGTDGLIGNRVVDLLPDKSPSEPVESGDRIASRKQVDTDEMLRTLSETNKSVLSLSLEVGKTIKSINESPQLNTLLNDVSLSADLKTALLNLRRASTDAVHMMHSMNKGVDDALRGKGTLGTLINDTTLALELQQAVHQIQVLELQAGTAVSGVDSFIQAVSRDAQSGRGPANMLLRDTLSAGAMRRSLLSMERSTVLLEENLEAMRSSFPFKKYFKQKGKTVSKAN
jgi:phospholipid/cholesterol/gamma-HCH transport system substrate-binding protein